VSLALALTAYDAWLGDARVSLEHLLDESMASLRCYLMQ
jgi:hypothetical protein